MSKPIEEALIERVARAILSGHNWANGDSAPKGFDEMTPDWQEAYRNMARAAIEAMREPNDEMKVAALNATFDEKRGDRVRVRDVPIIWQAMIDAALKQGEIVRERISEGS